MDLAGLEHRDQLPEIKSRFAHRAVSALDHDLNIGDRVYLAAPRDE